jgi:hypothetical protein
MKRILIAIGCIPMLYWVPMNVGLIAQVVPMLASSGEGKAFNVNYTIAWSFIPGTVHVRNLKIDGTDPNVHWEVKLRSVVFQHSLRALFDRVLSVQKLTGDSIQVTIRSHLETEKAAVRERLGPSVPTLPTDPLPWRLSISGITLNDLDRIKLDAIEFEGLASIHGGFMLLPGRELKISPSDFKIESGTLSSDGSKIFTEMKSTNLVTLFPADLINTHGNEIFRTMDILHSLDAQVLSSDFFGMFYQPYRSQFVGTTRGHVQTSVNIKGGVLSEGSKINSEVGEFSLNMKKGFITGSTAFDWRVDQIKGKTTAFFSVPLKNVQWLHEGRVMASVPLVDVKGSTTRLSLQDFLSNVEATVKAKDIRVIPANELVSILAGKKRPPSILKVDPGILDLDATFQSEKKRVNMKLAYSTPKIEVSYNGGKTKLIGKFKTALKVFSSKRADQRFELGEISTHLQSLRIVDAGKESYAAENWQIGLGLEKGTMTVTPNFELDGTLVLKMSDLKLPIRFMVPESFIAKIGTFVYPMRNFVGRGNFHFDSDEVAVRNFKADTSSGKIKGAWLSQDQTELAFVFQLPLIELCLSQKLTESAPTIRNAAELKDCNNQLKRIDQSDH